MTKTFNMKKCIRQIKEASEWHLGYPEYSILKKQWYDLIIKIIKSNIKEKPCQ